MASYNKIILLGNIGNVQVKTFANGGKVVEATMATTERYTDRNNEPKEETQWHNLVINGKLADFAEKYVTKGTGLFVTGQLKYRKYTTQAGENRTVAEIRVDTIQLLPKGMKEGQASVSATDRPAAPAAVPAPSAPVNPYLADLQAPEGEGDGDLPF